MINIYAYTIIIILQLASLPFAYSFSVDISGFLTFVTQRTDSKEDFYYRNRVNNKINFLDDTLIGLNFSKRIRTDLSASVQLLYKKELDDVNYYPEVEMAFMRYRLIRGLSITVGKVKLPIWQISEYRNIGFLYPWVIPPEELYENQTPMEEMTGLQVSYTFPLGPIDIELQSIIGQGRFKIYFIKDFTNPFNGDILDSYSVGDAPAYHYNLKLRSSLIDFKISYTRGKNTSDNLSIVDGYNPVTGNTYTTKVNIGNNLTQWGFFSAGFIGNYKKFEILSELGRGEYRFNKKSVISGLTKYITIVYKWRRIRPHFTVLFGKTTAKDPASLNINPALTLLTAVTPPNEAKVNSYSLGLNLLLTDSTNFKLQVKRIRLYGNADTSALFSTTYRNRKNPFQVYAVSINSVF